MKIERAYLKTPTGGYLKVPYHPPSVRVERDDVDRDIRDRFSWWREIRRHTLPGYAEWGGYGLRYEKGFLTDGASVPVLISGFNRVFCARSFFAATMHDGCYRCAKYLSVQLGMRNMREFRLFADRAFLALMLANRTPRFLAWSYYWGLRLGGWRTYYGSRSDTNPEGLIAITRLDPQEGSA